MPDYNPAIAEQIQVPQNNFAGTLGTVANIQAEQARTNLYTLQSLQQQRRYMGLTEMGNYYAQTHDAAGAAALGAKYGIEPDIGTQYINQAATQRAISAAGGMLPSNVEQLAGAAHQSAEAANARAQLGGNLAETDIKIRNGAAQAASQYATNPSPANRQAMIDYTRQFRGDAAAKELAGLSDDQLMARATGHIGGGLTAAQATEPVKAETAQGAPVTTTRLGLIGGSAIVGQTPQAREYVAQNTKDLTEANEQYRNANTAQFRLGDLRKNLDNLGGLLAPGAGFNERVAVARALDTAGINIGFTKDELAAAQASTKGSTYLGFDLAKTLGSREAAMIVQQSIGVQPGGQLSAEGNKRVWASLSVANQYNKDHATFMRQYLKQNPNAVPGDADAAFNQQHPVSSYISDVDKVVKIQGDKNKSGGYLVDDLAAGKGSAKEFDEHYGGSYSRYFGK